MRTASSFAPQGATGPSAGQGGSAPKWQQLRAIEEAREPLGLKATSINIIRAMLSFMSADRVSELAPENHIVYASNASIAQRAHVSVQTVERHIAKLVDLGIIQRVTAANGKRWCRRDGAGQVALISGLSLLPLAIRRADFTAVASQYQREQDALKKLRDECLLAIAGLQEVVSDGIQELLDRGRKILRRRPQNDVLQALLDEINAAIPVENSSMESAQPIKMTGGDNEIEGHKEPSFNLNSKKENLSQIQLTQDDMERAFPRLCAEIRLARCHNDAQRMMNDIAAQLNLGQVWGACREMGPAIAFVLLGYVLERVDSVQNHKAYLKSLVQKLDDGALEIQAFLKTEKGADRR